ncbi:MAG TPA: hypothetical protein VFK50_10495 [Sphingomicrobium sp.]|nr:hypothetical protein [Sphingomicrobium sp.]
MTQKFHGVPAQPIRLPATDGQARVDAVQSEYRADAGGRKSIRRDPPPRAPDIPPSDDPLSNRLADELDYARRLLEQMGDTLSSDPTVVARHLVTLQAVDVVGQMLGHIANVVRSSDPAETVERMGMADLRARLQRRGGV